MDLISDLSRNKRDEKLKIYKEEKKQLIIVLKVILCLTQGLKTLQTILKQLRKWIEKRMKIVKLLSTPKCFSFMLILMPKFNHFYSELIIAISNT